MIANFVSDDNPLLKTAILERIRQQGRLTFVSFMGMALYHPGEGYYTNRPSLIGAKGDFYTAPHVSSAFGEVIARQLKEMWERLDSPDTFTIVEMGAGQGLIAGDVLTYLKNSEPQMWPAVQYQIVEISEALIQAQAKRLSVLTHGAEFLERVTWVDWDHMEAESITGCFLSNELVDAFPVHLVTLSEGKLKEIYITANENDQFQEEIGPLSTALISDYFDWIGINLTNGDYPEGYRTEVNVQAMKWMARVARALARGYVLTIDYGYEADSRYHPRRSAGTLQCYYHHQLLVNPYINVGRMDITAHVDFTALQKAGDTAGLVTGGLTNQSIFLSTLGLGEMLAKISATPTTQNPNELLSQRNALMNLINPQGLGNNKVLLQAKNAPLDPPLTGFSL